MLAAAPVRAVDPAIQRVRCAAASANPGFSLSAGALRLGGRHEGRTAVAAVVFGVGHHVGGRRHAVGQVEEGGGLGEVEDVLLRQAVGAQGGAVGVVDQAGGGGELPGEVEQGALAGIEFRDAVVE